MQGPRVDRRKRVVQGVLGTWSYRMYAVWLDVDVCQGVVEVEHCHQLLDMHAAPVVA